MSCAPLNLDTLKTFDISPEQYESSIEPLEFHVSKHEKCFIGLLKSPDWPPNYSDERMRWRDLAVTAVTTTGHYAIAVVPSRTQFDDLPSSDIWSPDLHYILFTTITKISPGEQGCPLVLLELGLRPTPELDFGIGQLGESLSNSQRQQIKRAFSGGKKVLANVYGRKVNPLNDRLLGPDKSEFRGMGYLTEIEPKFKFKFTYEKLPANAGNVVAAFHVVNEWNWDNQTWGELVKVGEGGGLGLGAIVPDQPTKETTVQTEGRSSTTIVKGVWSPEVLLGERINFRMLSVNPPARRLVMVNNDRNRVYKIPAGVANQVDLGSDVRSVRWMIVPDEVVTNSIITYELY